MDEKKSVMKGTSIVACLLCILSLICSSPLEAGPLHDADNIAKVRQLLAQGADVNSQNELGQTPLQLAAFAGQTDIAALLIDL